MQGLPFSYYFVFISFLFTNIYVVQHLTSSEESINNLKIDSHFLNNYFGTNSKGHVPVPVVVALQHLATIYICKHAFRTMKANMSKFRDTDYSGTVDNRVDYVERISTAMLQICPLGESLEDIFQCDLFAKCLLSSGKKTATISVVRKGSLTVTMPKVKEMLALTREKNLVELDYYISPLVKRLAWTELILSKLLPDGGFSFQETFRDKGPEFLLGPSRVEGQGPVLSLKEVSSTEAKDQMEKCGISTNSVYRQVLIASGMNPDSKNSTVRPLCTDLSPSGSTFSNASSPPAASRAELFASTPLNDRKKAPPLAVIGKKQALAMEAAMNQNELMLKKVNDAKLSAKKTKTQQKTNKKRPAEKAALRPAGKGAPKRSKKKTEEDKVVESKRTKKKSQEEKVDEDDDEEDDDKEEVYSVSSNGGSDDDDFQLNLKK